MIGTAFAVLAPPRDWLYLIILIDDRRQRRGVALIHVRWSRMAQPISTQQEIHGATRPARMGVVQAIAAGGASLALVILLGALGLWFHYGTTVFFEMVASGIAACF